MLCLSMNMQLHYLAHQPLIINTETVTCIFNTNSIFTQLITTKRLNNLQLPRKLYIINNKSINFCLVSFIFLKYTLSVKFACVRVCARVRACARVCVCVCVCVRVRACTRVHISQCPSNLNSFSAVFISYINMFSISSITFLVIQLFSYFIVLSSPFLVY
jgi:hypothetical protein